MADEPHRITFLAKTFSAAALEFHRGRMAERGYRMEGRIEPTAFQMIDEEGKTDPVFDGEPLFTVTFVKRED
ncbi:AMP nucleosidase [Oceanicaulis sp. LC35]|uniref:AMP nucleosidase n=1 Tax=Oceanicaulis sp. LC35 TaxID=3349635 RepID=UPI003F84FE00